MSSESAPDSNLNFVSPTLTREELVREIVELREKVLQLEVLVEELQRRLNKPPKDPRNSSVPPSRGEKENKKPGARKQRRKRGFSSWRGISENPDESFDVMAQSCPHCQSDLSGEKQQLHSVREKIEVIIKTHITHACLRKCKCPGCGKSVVAQAPKGFEGSPFGRTVDALVLLLHYTQAVSYKRLKELMSQVFGLEISQGAIRNIIKRSQGRFERRGEEIMQTVRGSPVICSDETGTRVEGSRWWEWVFVATGAVLHVLKPTRAKKVIEEIMGEYEPNVWVSDLYGAQLGHGKEHQMCLAHQIRNLKYAIDCGDTVFAPDMRKLLCEAMDVGGRRECLDDAALEEYLKDFERRVDELLETRPTQQDAVRLKKRYVTHRDALFVFMKNRDVPYTNNVSERSIRMSKTFLKVTNGFRSQWGADMFGAVRSVINTGRLHGLSPYESILATLDGRSIINST